MFLTNPSNAVLEPQPCEIHRHKNIAKTYLAYKMSFFSPATVHWTSEFHQSASLWEISAKNSFKRKINLSQKVLKSHAFHIRSKKQYYFTKQTTQTIWKIKLMLRIFPKLQILFYQNDETSLSLIISAGLYHQPNKINIVSRLSEYKRL